MVRLVDMQLELLAFNGEGQQFKVVWPVLPTRSGRDDINARRQAVTLLYHDIKAKAMTASILGVRAAFFNYLALPDGRMASELATPELGAYFPHLLK